MIRRIPAIVKGPVIIALVVAGIFVATKAAYGGFGHYYTLTMKLPRAGQQLEEGSDVRLRGVVIGKVDKIQLAGRDVRLTLQIDDQYRVPASATGSIDLKTLLGSKFVNLQVSRFQGPFLSGGGSIRHTHIGPELEDALADGVQVLDAIRPNDLATIVHELSLGVRGQGTNIARSLRANAELSGVFASTLQPQLQELHDFNVVFGALKEKAVDLNRLADAINQGAPVYASARAHRLLRAALEAVRPFSDNLADLLILNRRDWDRMISSGDTVLGAIAARPAGLSRLVLGLYQYVHKLGGAPPRLPDGSAQAPFANFIGGSSSKENRKDLCGALPKDLRKHAPICNGTF
jgi:phospholipid/cholesterol/gamma-HCH transport system substrate-binding protein